jgi:hypothetical protein
MPAATKPWLSPKSLLCSLVALMLSSSGLWPVEANAGAICILPFSDQSLAEPMLPLRRPGPDSEYMFKIEDLPAARLKTGAPGISIPNVPAHRAIKVAVSLDGRPSETLMLDLRKEKTRSLCLELAYGYANWRVVEVGSRRCKCPR